MECVPLDIELSLVGLDLFPRDKKGAPKNVVWEFNNLPTFFRAGIQPRLGSMLTEMPELFEVLLTGPQGSEASYVLRTDEYEARGIFACIASA